MKAIAYLPVIGVGLALAGCKAQDTPKAEDAGPAEKQDTAAPTPDLLSFDDLAPAPDLVSAADPRPDAAPDLAGPDLRVKEDGPPAAPSDLATTPDAAPDLAAADLLVKADTTPLTVPDVATAPDTAPDLAPADAARDASSPTDLATFCTGGASKMIVNGISSNPAVSGKVTPYDCCDGGEFQIVTATYVHPVVISWRATVGSFGGFKTIDLANPPDGWSVGVTVGCGSAASCTDPVDSYTTGLSGSLSISIGKSAMYDMSVCLHVEEPVSSPHPEVHSLDVFATHIEAD